MPLLDGAPAAAARSGGAQQAQRAAGRGAR
jgi:hypothetical protein